MSDSTDLNGNIFVTRFNRTINPIGPPIFFGDTTDFRINSNYHVYESKSAPYDQLVFKLDAEQGDQWVIAEGGGEYLIGRVTEVNVSAVLGVMTTRKLYEYFYAPDSTDTTG